ANDDGLRVHDRALLLNRAEGNRWLVYGCCGDVNSGTWPGKWRDAAHGAASRSRISRCSDSAYVGMSFLCDATAFLIVFAAISMSLAAFAPLPALSSFSATTSSARACLSVAWWLWCLAR